MLEAKSQHCVCNLRGLIYVMGGKGDGEVIFSSVHRFDPAENSWRVVANLSIERAGLGAFVLGGSIYAVGGRDDENKRLTTVECYCITSDSWSPVIGGELGHARSALGVVVTRLEVGLLDSLITKATSDRL